MSSLSNQRNTVHQFDAKDMLPFIKTGITGEPVQLRSLDIRICVTGLYAETTQVMQFFNPNDRRFSGELIFPLPDNAVVCGCALDMDGRMREGVIVPKQEARKILEAEERKGADPGLVEQVLGNVYKIRIYPFAPKGSRTVSITYTTELDVSGNQATYHLPLRHATLVEEVRLKVEVNQAPCSPEITGAQGNMALTRWRKAWVAESTLSKGLVTDDLRIRLPDLPTDLIMVEKGETGECYFCISSVKDDRAVEKKWVAKNLAVAWDASGSRVNVERDLAFLKALVKMWPTLTLHIQVFRNELKDRVYVVEVKNGDPGRLIEFLKNLPYDGATALAALDLTALPAPECEAWLLFSDGLDTVTTRLPQFSGIKVFTINSGRESNAAYLEYLSGQSGAVSINLRTMPPESAAARLCTQKAIPKVLHSSGCEEISIHEMKGRTTITGRLTADTGKISMQYPGLPEAELVISSADAAKGNSIGRLWAGGQLQKLSLTGPPGDEKLLSLARRFGIVSPGTSLLVLEDIEQYIEHRIEPPASLPEMRNAYREAIKDIDAEEKTAQHAHLEHVASLWRERVEWWETEYDINYKKPARPASHSGLSDHRAADAGAMHSVRRLPEFENANHMRSMEISPSSEDDYALDMDESFEEDASAFVSGPPDETDDYYPEENGSAPVISIMGWDPDAQYLKILHEAAPADRYATYLQLRPTYRNSPSFFLDCGDYFLKNNMEILGVRILSNLLEVGPEDAALMRIYGWRLQQAGELDAAIGTFARVLALRDDEPQSHRDLALVLGDRWQRDGEAQDLSKAMQLLYRVVSNQWQNFPEIEIIALMELNRLIYLARQKTLPLPEYIDARLVRNLDLDIRISMSWDADMTDVDLHVFEPSGEHAYYAHNRTEIGGLVSRDFRQGYGPEEYVLRKAAPGRYRIKAHYFGSHQQAICGPCTVTVNIFTNFGRPDESRQVMTLRLEASGDDHLVGEIEMAGSTESQRKRMVNRLTAPFKRLRRGMTVNDVTNVVGQPRQVANSPDNSYIVLNYFPEENIKIEVCMGPDLLYVAQIMEGTRYELELPA